MILADHLYIPIEWNEISGIEIAVLRVVTSINFCENKGPGPVAYVRIDCGGLGVTTF
jgi:hypothetical protein